MWKGKKSLILVLVLALVLLFSVTSGVVFAQGGVKDQNTHKSPYSDESLAKLVEDGAITQEQADQLRTWSASKPDIELPRRDKSMSQDEWLASLVEDGAITQEQADQYKSWKASKPDVELPKPDKPAGGPPPGDSQCTLSA